MSKFGLPPLTWNCGFGEYCVPGYNAGNMPEPPFPHENPIHHIPTNNNTSSNTLNTIQNTVSNTSSGELSAVPLMSISVIDQFKQFVTGNPLITFGFVGVSIYLIAKKK